jgi:hypothetical protein
MNLKVLFPFTACTCLVLFGCQRQPDVPTAPRVTAPKPSVEVRTDDADSTTPAAQTAPTAIQAPESTTGVNPVKAALPKNAAELKAMRAKHDETIWSHEVLAQKHEMTFVDLWDRMIHQKDKFKVLREFAFNRLVIGTSPASETLDWQIQKTRFNEPTQNILREDWPAWVAGFEKAGYQIVETEFHHSAFQPSPDGATSKVAFLIHATHAAENQRYIVRGTLHIRWQPESGTASDLFLPDTIDATDIHILARQGNPAFVESRVDRFPTDPAGRKSPTTIHPVMLQDLDSDGLPEIIVAAFNHVYRNKGHWKFEFGRLCEHPVPHINAAAIADFDGDGIRDYMPVIKNGFPFLYKGDKEGRFTTPPRILRISAEPLRVAVNVVPGDIDGDGDLDVFIGQQKPGYFNGDIPTPYYDANDSFPAYLLLNDGQGNFTDITSRSGLGEKYRRRNFSASFIDYDEDNDLDLILTSDFAGTDLFENNGKGQFTDISATMQPQAYAFGMSHTFGDYNLDGTIDFLTVGMSSTTARRLEQLDLGREDFRDYDDARMKMGYGNRMYLFQGGKYVQAPFNEDVARTGWSWGSTTLDFDNDADPDIYVVNGQTSGQTTKDYCTSFWCHDVYYKRGERPDEAIRQLFEEMVPQFDGNGISWNGYEHNALLMNVGGRSFVNVGYLMNVSHEFDSRAAVSGDIDGDGRVDLIVEQKDLRANESKLYIVRNAWDQGGHWIGAHLRQSPGGASPIGARVTVALPNGHELKQHNVAGHSVWAQHDNTVHFGLGASAAVSSIRVHWPDGTSSTIMEPAINEYHVVTSGK